MGHALGGHSASARSSPCGLAASARPAAAGRASARLSPPAWPFPSTDRCPCSRHSPGRRASHAPAGVSAHRSCPAAAAVFCLCGSAGSAVGRSRPCGVDVDAGALAEPRRQEPDELVPALRPLPVRPAGGGFFGEGDERRGGSPSTASASSRTGTGRHPRASPPATAWSSFAAASGSTRTSSWALCSQGGSVALTGTRGCLLSSRSTPTTSSSSTA